MYFFVHYNVWWRTPPASRQHCCINKVLQSLRRLAMDIFSPLEIMKISLKKN